MTARDVLDYLEEIQPAPEGKYVLSEGAREYFDRYLSRYGFQLDKLTSKVALLDAIGTCNAEDFKKLVAQPPPDSRFHFIWHRLRQMAKT